MRAEDREDSWCFRRSRRQTGPRALGRLSRRLRTRGPTPGSRRVVSWTHPLDGIRGVHLIVIPRASHVVTLLKRRASSRPQPRLQ